MIGDIIITIMEWIGTVAFCVSGSLVAIRCGFDLFGVITVGGITAVGGGILRDILLGDLPPQVFFNPVIVLVAVITALLVFIIAYINSKKFEGFREKIERINILFDALGLAAFTVTGTEIACASGFSDKLLLSVTAGVITGVGGGILRDVLVNEKPYVLTKHIYAVASIIGSVVYYFAGVYFSQKLWGTIISVGLTILIRLLAAKFHWKLPKVKLS